jgi:hypothetical protein
MRRDQLREEQLRSRIKIVLSFFIVALVASGLTAFPIERELSILVQFVAPFNSIAPGFVDWVSIVNRGIQDTYRQYPFVAYGTDWLAFAHIVIAIAFIGPLRDPVRNIWVVEWGMIACVLVIPLAVIMNPIRGIPFFWTLIDCSFGVLGIIPLWIVRRDIRQIAKSD